MYRIPRKVFKCQKCGKEMILPENSLKKYCSRECAKEQQLLNLAQARTKPKLGLIGKPRSPEVIAKIKATKAVNGYKHSIDTRAKISETMKNTPGGYKPWNTGKKCPQLSGKNHHSWKGGITDIARLIRNSDEYAKWRTQVFERDRYSCQECGAIGGTLHAHHKIQLMALVLKYDITSMEQAIKYKALWDINNGKTLCSECHSKHEHVKNYIKYGGEPVKVYLSGYINNHKLRECQAWREKIINHYEAWNDGEGYPIIWLNPMNGDTDIRDEGMTSITVPGKVFFYRDYQAVKEADFLVVNLDTFGETRPLVGTLFEMAWAYEFRKPQIVITKDKTFLKHPFVLESAAIIVSSVEELLQKKYINFFFKGLVSPEDKYVKKVYKNILKKFPKDYIE